MLEFVRQLQLPSMPPIIRSAGDWPFHCVVECGNSADHNAGIKAGFKSKDYRW